MKNVYLALAVLGTVAPYAAFVPWVVEHGVDPALFVSEMFAGRVAAFFSIDVIVSAVVVVLLAVRDQRLGVRGAWLGIVGTLTVGVSCGLPLLLYLEARHDRRLADARGTSFDRAP
ncbi:MAG: DUF2834 domain-containing protein [Planctomycetota bacterium]